MVLVIHARPCYSVDCVETDALLKSLGYQKTPSEDLWNPSGLSVVKH